ncbi:hypothetical protein BGZ49_002859 [Haplosporangium sp. Z 27]|nr:hypothetical protein BGZ49_002859 [Haplosporangium sp. Z 27]
MDTHTNLDDVSSPSASVHSKAMAAEYTTRYINVEDKEEINKTGAEVARGPYETQPSRGLALVVLNELREKDEEPDHIAHVSTEVCKYTKPIWQVPVTVFL